MRSSLPSRQRLDRREQHGDGLADAGGGFEEKPPALGEHAIRGHRQLPLAGTIARKGEGERADGLVPLSAPIVLRPQPVQVDRCCLLEEGRQLSQGEAVAELSHLAGIEVQVGQLDGDPSQGVGLRVDEAVELGLGPMQRVGYPVPAALDGLDLLQQHLLRADEQTVNAPLNAQDELARLNLVAKPHLFLVAGRARTLEPLVAPGARQSAVSAHEVALAAKVALPQGKLDEFAHLHGEDWF